MVTFELSVWGLILSSDFSANFAISGGGDEATPASVTAGCPGRSLRLGAVSEFMGSNSSRDSANSLAAFDKGRADVSGVTKIGIPEAK